MFDEIQLLAEILAECRQETDQLLQRRQRGRELLELPIRQELQEQVLFFVHHLRKVFQTQFQMHDFEVVGCACRARVMWEMPALSCQPVSLPTNSTQVASPPHLPSPNLSPQYFSPALIDVLVFGALLLAFVIVGCHALGLVALNCLLVHSQVCDG